MFIDHAIEQFVINESESIASALEKMNSSKKRIILIGSVVDNIEFTELLENSGAFIASDFLCFGTRNFMDDVDYYKPSL